MMIAAGTHASKRSNSLVIMSDGGVSCNGSRVPGARNVAVVAAHGHVAMWVTQDGLVWKTGLEPHHTVIHGTETLYRTLYTEPVLVHHACGNAPVRDVAMGSSHVLLMLFDGRVLGMGFNIGGCLGMASSVNYVAAPEPLPGADILGPALSVSAGECATGIILRTGEAHVMGTNCWGHLGLGDREERRSLTRLEFPSPVLQLSMRYHGVAVLSNGDAYTWGRNESFQCGSGDTNMSHTPLLVRGPWSSRGVSSFACGDAFTVVVDMEGRVFMAGRCCMTGECCRTGERVLQLRETFTRVLGLPPTIVAVAADRNRAMYVDIDGGVSEGGVFAGGRSDVPPPSAALRMSGANLAPRAIHPDGMLAFAMGLHRRLGAESACRALSNDVVLRVMQARDASVNEAEDRRLGTAISASC